MEVITFESKAYQNLVERIESISDYISQTNPENTERPEIWLDSNEVAELLKISIRTLQRLRKDSFISYTMLRGKCLYKLSDIEKSLQERMIPTDPKTLENIRKKYTLSGIVFNK